MNKSEPDYIPVSEAAKILGLNHDTVLQHIHAGNLPKRKVGSQYLLTNEEVEDYAEARKTYQGIGRPPKT